MLTKFSAKPEVILFFLQNILFCGDLILERKTG